MYPTDFAQTWTRRPFALVVVGLLAAAGLCTPACSHDGAETSDEDNVAEGGQSAGLSPRAFKVNHDDWQKIGYKLDWVGFPFVGEGEHPEVTIMHAYDDLVIAQDSQTTVAAVEATNGRTRWSTQLAGPLTRFVGISRDPEAMRNVIVSSESEAFVLSVANGNIVGREQFGRVVNTAPILNGNLVVYGTTSGEVVAHALGRNVQAWAFAAVGSIVADPVAIGEVIGVVSQAGDVMFLNSAGSLLGRSRIYDGLDNEPVTDGDLLFIAGRDRSVWAFDTAGNLVWRHRTSSPLSAQPTAHAGVLYEDIPGQGLTAFEETTGKVLWSSPSVSGVVIGTRHGRLLVNKGETLMLVDPARGDVVDQMTAPGVVKVVLDKFDDGKIYAVNDRAVVAKFVPR